MIGGIKQCCDPSACRSVGLSRFLILSRTLDGGMRASPLQMHSTEGSTGGYRLTARYPVGPVFTPTASSGKETCISLVSVRPTCLSRRESSYTKYQS